MSRPRSPLLLSLTVSILAGCAAMKPGLGFDDVRQNVVVRTGARVHWKSGSKEDAEADAAVAALLERDLTADSAVQAALLNNRELQAVYEELNIAQADVVQAGLLRNPVFSGEVRFGVNAGGTAAVVDVAQDFVGLLSMPLRKGRAEAAFEAAKVRVAAEVLDLAFEVQAAFYDYQAAEQTREMRQAVADATAASYDLAQRLRNAGNNRELDVANQRALHEQSKLDLAAAEADVVRTRERLNALMGLWGSQTQSWHASVRLPAVAETEIAADGLERRAIETSLDMALLRREAEIAARTAGIARPFAWLDSADIGIAAERETEGPWSVGPSFSLPIPLFDQGQARIGEAEARYRQAMQRAYARAVEIRSRVRAAYSDVLSAHDRARYYKKVILPLRAEIVEQTQLQYNAMQVSAFELLQAKRDQIAAGAEYVATLREYWRARAILDQVLRGRMSPFEQTHRSTTSSPGLTGGGDQR